MAEMDRKYSGTIVFRHRPKAPKALGVLPGDWEYLTDVAARAHGDAWIRLLLGGHGHAASTRRATSHVQRDR